MFQPIYHVTPVLLERIKRITLLVHELNQRRVSEPVFAQLQTEARAASTFASTGIEGNPLPLTEVRRILKNRPPQIRQSEREVLNYNQVLSGLSQMPPPPLHLETLLAVHRGVMDGLLPEHQNGRFRQEPVIIHDPRSREVVYLPPDWQDVPALIADLLAFVATNEDILDPVLLAGLWHKQMVIIHPFIDGNGRSTRLTTTLLLARLGLRLFHLFSFENYYHQNVSRYFQHVGLFGDYNELHNALDFTPWLEYFAEGIVDELLRVEKQISLVQATPDTDLKPYHRQILAHIAEHGYITDKDYAALTERAKATRTLDFNYLIELGLLTRHGRGRSIHYRHA